MSNRRDIQFTFNPHNKATILDCNFIVTPTNAAGVTSLNASGRISSVFMHTSTTPAAGNPNPENGIIVVNLQDNYNTFLAMNSAYLPPVTGSNISISGTSVLTAGVPYIITAVGSSTQANWVTAGLSPNVTAAVGVSLISAITGGGTGTGTVKAVASAGSGIDHIEILGNPNLMNSNGANVLGAGQGMQIILAAFAAGVVTAPTTGTEIFLKFYLNNSAQGV